MYSQASSMPRIALPFGALPENLRPARERRRPAAVSTIPLSPFLARKGVIKPNTGDAPVPPAKGLRPSALPVRFATGASGQRPPFVVRLSSHGPSFDRKRGFVLRLSKDERGRRDGRVRACSRGAVPFDGAQDRLREPQDERGPG